MVGNNNYCEILRLWDSAIHQHWALCDRTIKCNLVTALIYGFFLQFPSNILVKGILIRLVSPGIEHSCANAPEEGKGNTINDPAGGREEIADIFCETAENFCQFIVLDTPLD